MRKITEDERRRRTRQSAIRPRRRKPEGEYAELGESLRNEIDADAIAIAESLWGGRPPGVEKLSEQEYLDYLRAEWPKPDFRNKLLLQVGPMNFLATFAALVEMPLKDVLEWSLTEPTPQTAAGMVPPGGIVNANMG